jgi:hypothetical protein
MREKSQIEDMRAAIRGDIERARARREADPWRAQEPETVAEEKPAPSEETAEELVVSEGLTPEGSVPAETAEEPTPEPDAVAEAGDEPTEPELVPDEGLTPEGSVPEGGAEEVSESPPSPQPATERAAQEEAPAPPKPGSFWARLFRRG